MIGKLRLLESIKRLEECMREVDLRNGLTAAAGRRSKRIKELEEQSMHWSIK